ncbi:MAG: hypothetical protein AAB681_02375 [Patescibacteria group bacterium]
METLTSILVYVVTFLLVSLIVTTVIYIIKHWNYDVLLTLKETHVVFDVFVGEISWNEKVRYRRHRHTKVWYRKSAKRMCVAKHFIFQGKLRMIYKWENVSRYKAKRLEKKIKGKPPP